jgi:predicted RNA binding protein YcfA (HicA-like mRNA interferase family)
MWNGHCARPSIARAERILGDASEAHLVERNSRKLIRMLEDDGWVLDRVNGDHHTFKHPERDKIITVTHPRRDLPTGLVRRIYKLAGWRP